MRTFNSIVLTIILVTVCICSCNKQNDLLNDNSYIKFNSLNEEYFNSIRKGHDLRINWKKILGADLKGALSGAGVGAGIGLAVGGMSAGFGAGLGALIGGAGESLEAADGTAEKKSMAMQPNDNNPYDNIGFHHYNCLNLALENNNNYIENGIYSNSNFYIFCKNYLINNGVYFENNFQYFTLNNSNVNFDYVKSKEILSINEFNELLFNNNKISSFVYNYLAPYFECLLATNNITNFVNYSINAENLVVSSSLTSIDKQIVLEVMSTARYGIQYWNIQ